jgi:hypothetical protein
VQVSLTSRGFYAVRDLPPGKASVQVRARGRVSVTEEVDVPTTGLAIVDAKLTPGVRYTGRVVNVRGEAVADVRVAAKEDRPDSGNSWFAFFAAEIEGDTTAKDGAFAIDGLAPSHKYTLVFHHPRYLTLELPGLDGSAGGAVEALEALLEDAAWVTGTVVDGAGKPIAGARVLSPSDDGGWKTWDLGGITVRVYIGDGDDFDGSTATKTDAQGRFEIGSLKPTEEGETLLLRARAMGYFNGETRVEGLVAGTAKGSVVLKLETGTGTVAGVVVDDQDAPVKGAAITVDAEDTGRVGVATADGAGRFQVGRLASKQPVTVAASATGYERGRVEKVALGEKEAKVVLRRLAHLTLRVLGDDGKPLPRVTIYRVDPAKPKDDPDADTYEQGPQGLDLPLGIQGWKITASAPGYELAEVGEWTPEPGQKIAAGDVKLTKAADAPK